MRCIVLGMGLLGLVACGTSGQPGWSRGFAPEVSGSALAAIRTRDYKVTWRAGQKLLVQHAAGTVVADGVTSEDLEAIDPFLHAACTNATASNGYLDASGERGLGLRR